MEIVFPVEFVVIGTPVSLQGSSASKDAWKARVKNASYVGLPEQHWWYEGPVAVTIYYFPAAEMEGDIDNIVKPILDSLCAHIYEDDRQVVRVTVQKFEPDQPAIFAAPAEVLLGALAGDRPFTFIRITDSPFEDPA